MKTRTLIPAETHTQAHERIQNNLRWSHKFLLKPSDMENNIGKSETVPNETYTIKELVQRFSKGMDPAISRLAEWDEETDYHSMKNMDFDEIHEHKLQIAERMEQIKNELGGLGDVPPVKQPTQQQQQQQTQQQQQPNTDAPAVV